MKRPVLCAQQSMDAKQSELRHEMEKANATTTSMFESRTRNGHRSARSNLCYAKRNATTTFMFESHNARSAVRRATSRTQTSR